MNRILTFQSFLNERAEAPVSHEPGEPGKTNSKLEVKTSTIPNAGNGLFTVGGLKKGEKIDQYTGHLISAKEADDRTEKAKKFDPSVEYFINLSNGKVLDVYDSDCLARIANDAEGYVKQKGFSNNAEIVEYPGKKVFLVASKNIPAGGEIFTAYGKEYWMNYKKNLAEEA